MSIPSMVMVPDEEGSMWRRVRRREDFPLRRGELLCHGCGSGTDLPVLPQMMVFLPGGMCRVTFRRAGVSLLVVVSEHVDGSIKR